MSERARLELINEANILQKSRHPFVIGLHGLLQIQSGFALVLEYATLGSLHDYYQDPMRETPSLHQRVLILYQVAAGMAYLHDTLKIMHNDLKSPNVLLTQHMHNGPLVSKITDFGLSRLKTETMTRSRTSAVAGTPLWLAPERKLMRPKISNANDVFSFAVLMTEVVSWVGVYGISWDSIDVAGVTAALLVQEQRESLIHELDSD
ncbi:kinase-like domain-containing protein, partial [Zopfochytrium polystomum]